MMIYNNYKSTWVALPEKKERKHKKKGLKWISKFKKYMDDKKCISNLEKQDLFMVEISALK